MTDENQQTVDAGAGTEQKAPDAVTQAGDTLDTDAWLEEFEGQTASKEEKPEPETADDPVQQKLAELERWKTDTEKRTRAESTTRLVNDLVTDMKKAAEMDGISDAFMRRFLVGTAEDDPRWAAALTDPKARTRAVRELAEMVKKEVGAFAESRTAADRKAVKDSVRGLSNQAPDDDDKPMPTSDFERLSPQEKMKYLGGKLKGARLGG